MPIEAILLDLDDTLIPDDSATEAALRRTIQSAALRHAIDPETLASTLWRHARELWHAAPTYDYAHAMGISASEGLWGDFEGEDPNLKALRKWTPSYRRRCWTYTLAEHGIEDPQAAEALDRRFPEERRAALLPYPKTRDALVQLRKRCRLGMITNGAPDMQREKLETTGLDSFFEAILISGDVGIGKPDPGIFRIALDRMKIEPDRAVMVGDNPGRDLLGARRAGMRGIWVRRYSSRSCEGIEPDAVLETVADLPGWLDSLHAEGGRHGD